MKRFILFLLSAVMLISSVYVSSADEIHSCTEGFICGDANGDGNVNAKDVSAFLKYFADMESDVIPEHMDTNCDGKTNTRDCAYMLKFLAEWDGIYRLGHTDICEVTEEPLTDKKGVETIRCTKCGDFIERETDYAIISVCGNDLADYTVFYDETIDKTKQSRLKELLAFGASDIIGLEFNVVDAGNMKKPLAEHEILFGRFFQRDGLPTFNDGLSHFGVTEDGTIYFSTESEQLYEYMWEAFLNECMGASMKFNTANKKGCEILPFDKTLENLTYERLETDGYKLVFEDNFDGDSLNMDLWRIREEGQSRGNYMSDSQVEVKDGNLYIHCNYRDDGKYGAGWYASSICLIESYTRGYFEIRAKCNEQLDDVRFWSAFWLQSPAPYDWALSQGGAGPGGAEIDVVECGMNGVASTTIWCCGSEGVETTYLDCLATKYKVENAYTEYHTYALEWDENYYTMYVDSVPVFKSDFAKGTSPAPADVVLSVCLPAAEWMTGDHSYDDAFEVDYLRIMQK